MNLLPTWGTVINRGATERRKPLHLVSMDVPTCWAFAAREGTNLPSQGGTIEEFNNELIRGSRLLFNSPQDALNAINSAYDAMTTLLPKLPTWMRNGEEDVTSKLSIQRRHSALWFMLPQPPSSADPTDEYKRIIDALAAYYGTFLPKKALRMWAAEDSDPPDTVSGWPLFTNQMKNFTLTLGSLFLPFLARDEWPDHTIWIQACDELARQTGIPGDLFTVAVARRAGPTRKALPYSNNYWEEEVPTAFGAYTRTRLVYMVSRIFNIAISPLSQQVKYARSRIHGFWHTPAERRKQMADFYALEKAGNITYESDFSGYDTSFTPQHRLCIYDALERYGFASQCLNVMRAAEDRWNIVTPSPEGPTLGHAAVYRGRNGLLSGMKETSNLDSLHAQAIVLKFMVRKGLTDLARIRKGEWPLFLNLGDDVLLSLPKNIKVSEYEASCSEEGIKAKVFEGCRMLMRHIHEGRDYPVTARILQQTLANEDSYDHPGHFLLGLAARLKDEPFPGTKDMITSVITSAITGDCSTYLRETGLDVSKLLHHPQTIDFINSSRGKSWLMKELALDSRPTSSVFEAIVAELGVSLPELLTERSEQLTLLFSTAKPLSKYRSALGALINYR